MEWNDRAVPQAKCSAGSWWKGRKRGLGIKFAGMGEARCAAAERVESVLLLYGDLIICKVERTARVYGVSRVQTPKQELTEQTAPYGFRVEISVESKRGRSGRSEERRVGKECPV